MYSNAGVLGLLAGALDFSKEDFERVMAVNVRGTALAVKHAARAMLARGVRGSIVCTASVAGRQGGHAFPVYTMSKHAVVGLVRAAAADLGQHGIRVNSVSPFMVATGMSTGMHGSTADTVEEFSAALANLKGGRVLKAAHVAEAAMFLASEESAFISGHDLVVDGGASVVYPSIMPALASLSKL
ncbi:putative short-chain dehydrogenase reductase 5 [Iris pallida]|uniref:Short-chain dehydrogenase reductase 5 n=1 Tax=Iris pallida TaxID=29817 RepID=A0AAX6GW28_IRIPA|nr:putative short-chain dehydrogenase reductase 5 [Iris pallida]